MSDLTERRGGLARLRLALAELEPAELAEALADVDAIALARVSHARVPVEAGECKGCGPGNVSPPRLCGPDICVACCAGCACSQTEPL